MPQSQRPSKSEKRFQRMGMYFKHASFGLGTLIQLRGKKLWYCKIMGDGVVLSQELIHPQPAQWSAFWQEMDRAGVWDWKPRYEIPEILDGTWWELRLRFAGKIIRSTGQNSFPGSAGSTYSPYGPFGIVCKALRRLCAGKPID